MVFSQHLLLLQVGFEQSNGSTFSRSSNLGGSSSLSRFTTALSEMAPPIQGLQLGRSRLMGATRDNSLATWPAICTLAFTTH